MPESQHSALRSDQCKPSPDHRGRQPLIRGPSSYKTAAVRRHMHRTYALSGTTASYATNTGPARLKHLRFWPAYCFFHYASWVAVDNSRHQVAA